MSVGRKLISIDVNLYKREWQEKTFTKRERHPERKTDRVRETERVGFITQARKKSSYVYPTIIILHV